MQIGRVSVADKVKLRIRWKVPEDPELAASSLATGLARILRPEAFKLSRDAAAALVGAHKIVAQKPKQVPKEEIVQEIRDLQSRLAELTALVGEPESVQ
jgi:hypothetical protein